MKSNLSQSQKLEALVRKVIDGGYHTWEFDDRYTKEDEYKYLLGTLYDDPSENSNVQSVEALIFDHDFAKALFGEGDYYKLNDPKRTIRKLWEHKLQQAVISKDPIDYLYGAVFGEKE